jgi:hypothetical protein
MFLMNLIRSLLILCLVFGSTSAFAQDSVTGGNDISLYVGKMLPNQIDGVDEILPVFGGRYGLGFSFGLVEFGLANTHAEGVDFTTFETSYRYDLPLEEGLLVLVGGGLDLNYYKPEGESSRKTEVGLHVNTGAMMAISNAFWLRGDLKFMGGPGTSLSLLFGIVIRDTSGAN